MIESQNYPKLISGKILISYCAIVHLCGWLFDLTYGGSIFVAHSIILAVFVNQGAYAALGSGNYLRRVATMTLSGTSVFIAFASSAFLVNGGIGMLFYESFELNYFVSLVVAMIFAIPLIVAAHLPFLLINAIFGWHLNWQNHAAEFEPFKISRAIVVTAIISIALACPNIVAKTIATSAAQAIQLGESVLLPVSANNNSEFSRVVISEDNIDFGKQYFHERFEHLESDVWNAATPPVVVVVIFAIAFTPAIWLSLRGRSMLRFLFASSYLIAFVFVASNIASLWGANQWVSGGLAELLFGIAFAVASILPLTIAKRVGIELATRKKGSSQDPESGNHQ